MQTETTQARDLEPASPQPSTDLEQARKPARKPAKKRKRRNSRALMDLAAEACGMVKVRGALGGIYYE